MNIEGSVLKELCDAFHFPIGNDPIILFAFRGCLPKHHEKNNTNHSNHFKSADQLTRVPVNYLNPRCTIGIWDRITDKIALFPGSTLPSKDYVKRHPSSVSILNVLCPGSYQLRKGIHPRNEEGFQRHEALLMDGFGIVGLPHIIKTSASIRFSSRIVNYDVVRPGDNLHAGRMEPTDKSYFSLLELKYSSCGCITVAGQPEEYLRYNRDHTAWNSWTTFIQILSRTQQKNFTFLLFNFDSCSRKSVSENKTIRYGSKQSAVGDIQYLLSNIVNTRTGQFYYSGDFDCSFSDQTAVSYFKFCKDYSSSKTEWEVQPQKFFNNTKHFMSLKIHPENAIQRSSTNY
ncbi:MAG TPA: hypothetical protein VE467_01290 [Chryseolinea sp.]|jgi:hypothetical protein|nr:hypothetical protein [Chryseolinea sp.]